MSFSSVKLPCDRTCKLSRLKSEEEGEVGVGVEEEEEEEEEVINVSPKTAMTFGKCTAISGGVNRVYMNMRSIVISLLTPHLYFTMSWLFRRSIRAK